MGDGGDVTADGTVYCHERGRGGGHAFVENQGSALDRLRELVERMQVEDPVPTEVLLLMKRYAPEMDYADACAVLLARRHKGAVVLTTIGTFRLSRALRVAERRAPRVRS